MFYDSDSEASPRSPRTPSSTHTTLSQFLNPMEVLQENSPLLEKTANTPKLSQITCDHLALIIDGDTLLKILGDTVCEHMFLSLAMLCRR